MKKTFFLISILASFITFSQEKNFIDKPYLEVQGKADTLVTPNRIYIDVLISEKDVKGKKYTAYHQNIALRWNKWFAYEKALENNYGFTRVNYSFSARSYGFFKTAKNINKEKEYLRLNANFSYAINQINNRPLSQVKHRLNAEITVNYSFKFMRNTFLMATAGYYGEDPYNIYFEDQYSFLRFGIATGFIRNKSD